MPDVIPGGSPRNPMGVAAMTLEGGEYAIHGTNKPVSVGGFVSYGCHPDVECRYQPTCTKARFRRHDGGRSALISIFVIPGCSEAPDPRCAIAHRGISKISGFACFTRAPE